MNCYFTVMSYSSCIGCYLPDYFLAQANSDDNVVRYFIRDSS